MTKSLSDSMSPATRREMLRRFTALSCVGAAASTFGLQLATMGSAAAQTAPATYKALVCIFMFGGNDANNMVLATDNDSWGRYFSARNTGQTPIALMPVGTQITAPGAVNPVTGRVASFQNPEGWGGVLPVTSAIPNPVPPGTNASVRTFALNPHLAALVPLWTGGRLAAAANVGPLIVPTTKAQYRARSVPLPRSLMSHNDQQSTWQAGSGEGARKGWGGMMADQFLATNGVNSVFTAISTAGNAVMLAGDNVVQYQMSTSQTAPAQRITAATTTGSIFGASGAGARVREIIRDSAGTSYFMQDHASKVVRSMDAADLLNAQFAAGSPGAAIGGTGNPNTQHQLTNPITRATETNQLAVQLQSVAKVIAANSVLGVKRQVFFVSIGGFDNHDIQNTTQSPLMARLAHAMAYFDNTLANINGVDMRPQVTTFTASDFSRTFTTNGDGTDHAWGAHHFVMGGDVIGGSVYGQYPTLGIDVTNGFQNPNMSGNVLIPQMSVDQYGGTIGRWFGLSDGQLDVIFPNLHNFSRNVGFMNAPTA
jgi:uncharacterized protein (DUF1501 family)